MKSLAIDYGSKRFGFAVGHSSIGLASPLQTHKRSSLQEDLQLILLLIREHEVDELVIGRPLNMDGSESVLSKEVNRFAAFLRKRIPLPILFVDERLSSREAEARLRELPSTFARKKSALDAMSAVIILERHFQRETHG